MIKTLTLTVLALLLAFGPAFSETVKVLIIEEGFKDIPADDDRLAMLDRITGSLVVGDSSYGGEIEVWSGKKGLYLINELPLEEYVEGVVAAESGRNWEEEALKAQAVVVRTYAVNNKLKSRNKKFHVTSSVLHQVYKGQNSDSGISNAVSSTVGEVLTFGGEPIEALYHSTCGGKTEDSKDVFNKSLPYLRPVVSSCKLSPLSVWSRKIPLEEVQQATGIKNIKSIKIKSRTESGRVKELDVETSSGKTTATLATELRKALGWKRLPSTDFSVRMEDDAALFEGRGYGHGVGLCQWSALELAKEGKSYREILEHFYPGASIELYESKRL